jgi:C4-type Zn-finger protein
MNKIICDECKAEIKQTKALIEIKYLGEIQINFFRCRKCNAKYLVGVTDAETREKQQELRKWSEQHKKALDIDISNFNEEEIRKVTMLADECKINMDRLQAEIKASMEELKIKYEGEL